MASYVQRGMMNANATNMMHYADEDEYSYTSSDSDDSSELSSLGEKEAAPSVVRRQLFQNHFGTSGGPAPSMMNQPPSSFTKPGFSGKFTGGATTPSTVHMSQYSPSSSIVTPNSTGVHQGMFPKMPNMPPTSNNTGGGTMANPGSLAYALGIHIDDSANAAPIREQGHIAPPVQPHHGTTFVGYAPRPGSLAAALCMMVDPSVQAAPIREHGHVAPPIQSHYGTTHYSFSGRKNLMETAVHRVQGITERVDYNNTTTANVASAQPGSLAAALGMKIDCSGRSAPPIREYGHSAPPIQTHFGTTFKGYSQNHYHHTGGGKKSLTDMVLARLGGNTTTTTSTTRTAAAQPGSLAAALGMKIDASYQAAPICEMGHTPPPIQTHYGTTFKGYSARQQQVQYPKGKKSLMDAVMTRVHTNSMDRDKSYAAAATPSNNQAVVTARAGSLAAALGMKIDASYQAAPIRETGHSAPPIQTHYGTTFKGYASQHYYYHHQEAPRTPGGRSLVDAVMTRVRSNSMDRDESYATPNNNNNNQAVVTARAGSLAAALGMKIDASYQAAPIRETGQSAPPIQTHYGTTFKGYYAGTSQRPAGQNRFMDAVMNRVRSSSSVDSSLLSDDDDDDDNLVQRNKKAIAAAAPGSLAAALGMKIDYSSRSAPPIREKGHSAPPIQTHYGTTFLGPTACSALQKKSLMDAVFQRMTTADASMRSTATYPMTNKKKKKKMTLMDAVMSKVRLENIKDDEDTEDSNDNYYYKTAVHTKTAKKNKKKVAVVAATPGSLAAVLGMKIDASTQAAPIREKGHTPPPVQPHNGTTFIGGAHYSEINKSGGSGGGGLWTVADMAMSRRSNKKNHSKR